MGSEQFNEVKESLAGSWLLDRSENFDEALKAMGLNVVFRKLASHAKPSMEIQVEDGKVKIIAKASFFTQTMTFPINEPYDQEFEGIKMKCFTKWENNKLITEANPVEPEKDKPQKFHRERVNDELVQTMWIGDVKCTRWFKQQT
ncbi:cellular retinoic acid-binding protein 1-like isoform X1 [Ruditapes philippinarum]|uniref:cellular retinoic acid-binding protein 1-like isoform X1 n=1 Tax=Ruditapes philippinarum TaxID=129788 RepID=UPI00295B3778|nr:cellular retinoic acid-binding protein 1-like isoform X1 [Ruditapes philippinarum]